MPLWEVKLTTPTVVDWTTQPVGAVHATAMVMVGTTGEHRELAYTLLVESESEPWRPFNALIRDVRGSIDDIQPVSNGEYWDLIQHRSVIVRDGQIAERHA